MSYRAGDNPASWETIGKLLPARGKIAKVEHHAALPFVELPKFLAALRRREGVAAQALQFLILTAARTSEVTGATWGEIDFQTKIWTVPAGRMKGGAEHRVPLSPAAITLLQSAYRVAGDPFIFVGPTGGLSNAAMAATLKRMGLKDITVHGFRSCFRDWAGERTNYPNHVVEMALAHKIGNAVEAAYRRGDLMEKRRRLMTQWAAFCTTEPVTAGEVVPIRALSR
jgi:integrase